MIIKDLKWEHEDGYKGGISIEGRWENMELQAPVAIETLRKQLG